MRSGDLDFQRMSLSLFVTSEAKADRLFASLAADGTVLRRQIRRIVDDHSAVAGLMQRLASSQMTRERKQTAWRH
jgi:hypothetical protein